MCWLNFWLQILQQQKMPWKYVKSRKLCQIVAKMKIVPVFPISQLKNPDYEQIMKNFAQLWNCMSATFRNSALEINCNTLCCCCGQGSPTLVGSSLWMKSHRVWQENPLHPDNSDIKLILSISLSVCVSLNVFVWDPYPRGLETSGRWAYCYNCKTKRPIFYF